MRQRKSVFGASPRIAAAVACLCGYVACGGGGDDDDGSGSGGSGQGASGGTTDGSASGSSGKGGSSGAAGRTTGGSSGTGTGGSASGGDGNAGGEAGSGTGGTSGSGGTGNQALRLVVHDVIPIEAGPCMPETIVPITGDAVTFTPSSLTRRYFVEGEPDTVVDAGTCMVQGNSTVLCPDGDAFTLDVDIDERTLIGFSTSAPSSLEILANDQPIQVHPLGNRRYAALVPGGTTALTFGANTNLTVSDVDLAPTVGQDLGTLDEYRRYSIVLRGNPQGVAERLINPTFYFRAPDADPSIYRSCGSGTLYKSTGCGNTDLSETEWTTGEGNLAAGDLVYLLPRSEQDVEEVRSAYGAITVGNWGGDEDLMTGCHAVEFHFSLDSGDTPVADLDVDQIAVTMNGDELTVEAGATLEVDPPTRVGLLLDGSYSITASGAEANVRDAAKDFVNTMSPATLFTAAQFASEETVPVPIFSSMVYRGDPDVAAFAPRDGNVTYGTQSDMLVRLDEYDAHPIVTSESATKLFDALANASISLFTEDSPSPPVISSLVTDSTLDVYKRSPKALLVLSDGTDTASMNVENASTVRQQLDGCHVRAYAVAMGDDVDTAVLDTIAGNEVFTASTPEALAETFEDVAARIRSTYVLRVVLPAPVTLDSEAVITVDYGGQRVSATYENPGECGIPF
jgi:hypothetical protein